MLALKSPAITLSQSLQRRCRPLLHLLALTCQHYFPPIRCLKPQIYWNFNCTSHSFRRIITISGFGRHFRLWVIIEIAQVHFLRVGHGRIPQVRRWNFDDMCHSFADITTSNQLDFQHELATAMTAGDLEVSHIVINPYIFFGTTCVGLSVKPAKLLVLTVTWQPSQISNTHRRPTKSEVTPLQKA